MRGRCGSKKGKAGRALWSNNAHCPSTHLVAPLGPVYSNGDREAEEREGHTGEINHTACKYAEGASSRPSADALDEPHKKRGGSACQPFFPRRMYSVFVLHSPSKNGDGCGRPARGHDRTWGGPGRATQCTRCKRDPSFCTRAPVPALSARVATPGLGRKHHQAAVFLVALPPPRTLPSSRIQHDAQLDYYSKRLATCSSDRKVKVFDVSGAEQVQIAELPGCVACVCLPAHTITPCGFFRGACVFLNAAGGNWRACGWQGSPSALCLTMHSS
jgi:hypothetical protein